MIDYDNIRELELSSYKQLGSLDEDTSIATNSLSNAMSAIYDGLSSLSDDTTTQLARKLDKYDGGTVSGDVTISQHSMKVLSGNYIQTHSIQYVNCFNNKNSFLQAECENGEYSGFACAGSRGFCIVSAIPSLNAVKLRSNIDKLQYNLDKKFSWIFEDDSGSEELQISSVKVDAGMVFFTTELPSKIALAELSSEEQMIAAFDKGRNALYCPSRPDIGTYPLLGLYGNHAEGGSIKAIGKYTHAEGCYTIADLACSHAEGNSTFAGGIASHAEGGNTKAYGYCSHAEGMSTYVNKIAEAAHAEGKETSVFGAYSHAEGWSTVASLSDRVASHAEGWQTSALGSCSHAEGSYSIAEGNGSHAEGGLGSGDSAPGGKATGRASHAEGLATWAKGEYSHAEGYKTQALGNGSHAEGGWNSGGLAGGKAEGHGSHAEGYNTWAKGRWSHAEGSSVSAIGNASHASGQKAIAKKERQFVWNGIDANYDPYESTLSAAGDGSFCINPTNGLSNFWIGKQNLCAIINVEIGSAIGHSDETIDSLKSSISSAISNITLDSLSSLDENSSIESVISSIVEIRNILSNLYDAIRE